MEKRLILIRHAHRDTSDRSADNGLSKKGWDQAQSLAAEFVSRFKDQKPVLLSSARIRCMETLEPISTLTGVKIKTDARLIEQEFEESFGDFEERAENFVKDWKKQGVSLLLICSHGDWLPVALKELTGSEIEMKKGAWAEVVCRDEHPKLERLIQRF